MYRHLMSGNLVRKAMNDTFSTLASITTLKKLCNSPALLWDKAKMQDDDVEGLIDLYPKGEGFIYLWVVYIVLYFEVLYNRNNIQQLK